MLLVPGERIGVVVFTNTGPFSPLAAALPVANAVLRTILRPGDDAAPSPVPAQPWTWRDLCGWYSFGPGILTDPQPRMLGPAAEVAVRHGQLVLRGQLPVPAVRRGLALHPDGADPDTFRISMPGLGSATSPAVFSRGPDGKVTALHLAAQPLSLHKQPDARNPRPWAAAAVAGGAVALAARHRAGPVAHAEIGFPRRRPGPQPENLNDPAANGPVGAPLPRAASSSPPPGQPASRRSPHSGCLD